MEEWKTSECEESGKEINSPTMLKMLRNPDSIYTSGIIKNFAKELNDWRYQKYVREITKVRTPQDSIWNEGRFL